MNIAAHKRDPKAPRGGQPYQFRKYVRPASPRAAIPPDPFQKVAVLASGSDPELRGWEGVHGGYQRKVYLG